MVFINVDEHKVYYIVLTISRNNACDTDVSFECNVNKRATWSRGAAQTHVQCVGI